MGHGFLSLKLFWNFYKCGATYYVNLIKLSSWLCIMFDNLCPPHLARLLRSRCCLADSHSWGVTETSESHRWHPWPPAPFLHLLLLLPLLIHCWRLSPACSGAPRTRRMGRRWRSRCWPWRRWAESWREPALAASRPWWSTVRIGFASCPSFSSSPRPRRRLLLLLVPLLRFLALSWRAGGVCSQRTRRGLSSRWLRGCGNSHTASRPLK